MKRHWRATLAIAASLLVAQGAAAQSSDNKPQATGIQRPQPGAKSAELTEEQRLSAAVVKLYDEGKYDEALPLAKRALEIREKAVGVEHPSLAALLGNLIELYLVKRKYGEAEKLLQRLLAINEKQFGPEHARMAAVLGKMAFVRFMKSDFDEAESLHQRALAIMEKQFGPDDPEIGAALFELAEFYRLRGKYEKAEPLFQRAIRVRGKKYGREDRQVQLSMERYACVFYERKESDKVKELWKQFDFLDTDKKKPEMVLNGKAISLPRPEYPSLAKENRVSGTVVVKITIDEAGLVKSAADMCGAHPFLRSAAEQAALRARFTPTLLGGKPVKVEGVIVYNFVGR